MRFKYLENIKIISNSNSNCIEIYIAPEKLLTELILDLMIPQSTFLQKINNKIFGLTYFILF